MTTPLSSSRDAGPETPAANDLATVQQVEAIIENFSEGALYQYAVETNGRQRLTYLSPGAERILGARPPQLPVEGEWLLKQVHPADQPQFVAAIEHAVRETSDFHGEVRIRPPGGVERWVCFRSRPRVLSPETIAWDGVMMDVTDQRRAEQSVRRQADFLRALNQTTLELVGRRNVSELLRALVERASSLLRSPHAEISLLEDGDLVVRAFSPGPEDLGGNRVRPGEPALSWDAIARRQPVIVDHYDTQPGNRDFQRARGVRAAAIFPIIRGAECIGVLGVGREEPDAPFTSDDIQEGTLLAQMAALVLFNAGLHEEAVREAEARTTALRESEERFRAVFYESPIAISLLSIPDGHIIELNAAALAAFGFTREEAIGKTSSELNVWADPQLRSQYIERLVREGSISEFEAQMRRKNGELFTVLHSGTLVMIGGRPYNLNSLQDITGRKQSEIARDRSLALMRATLESTADGILVVNEDGHIETYNFNFAEMWGLEPHAAGTPLPEEAILHRILDQLAKPERFLAGVLDLYSRSEDEVFDVLHCKDGRIFERFSRPQLMGQRPVGRVWSFRDITDSRRAEVALRASEERFRLLAEVSPVGIFSADAAGRTTFVNRRWCEFSGLTPEQAKNQGWTSALHPDDRARVLDAWNQAVQARESSAAEFRFVRPDGKVTWLVGQSSAQRNPDGSLAGYVGTVTDVTSLKRAEEDRKKIDAQLRQSSKMESLGTLAGGIAHDFNNILTGTFGFLDLARLELPPGHPAHNWLDRIAASSQRARDLVRQILTFSRKNEGARIPQRLHVVVGEALRMLRSTLPPMVTLEHRISGDTPAVLADALQIQQVVLNLCTNAWHALPARGGRISVSLDICVLSAEQASVHPDLRPGSWVRLVVADDGCGMDAATLEHIFEPFFTTKETGTGTGLGLAVVHGILKSHQGAVVVHSTPKVGSTFELYFPVISVDAERLASGPAAVPMGHGERVMVVDDDTISGFAIEKLVETLGYRATRFVRPEDALAHLTANPTCCDLLVTDLAMPGMNGGELMEHVSRVRPDLPVIVLTGFVEPAKLRALESSRARVVLHKPVSRDDLSRAISEHVLRAK